MNIDSNKVLEWMEDNVEDCFIIGDNGVYHLDTFLLEDKYKVFVDQAKECEDETSVKIWDTNEMKIICDLCYNYLSDSQRSVISNETFFNNILMEYKAIKESKQ